MELLTNSWNRAQQENRFEKLHPALKHLIFPVFVAVLLGLLGYLILACASYVRHLVLGGLLGAIWMLHQVVPSLPMSSSSWWIGYGFIIGASVHHVLMLLWTLCRRIIRHIISCLTHTIRYFSTERMRRHLDWERPIVAGGGLPSQSIPVQIHCILLLVWLCSGVGAFLDIAHVQTFFTATIGVFMWSGIVHCYSPADEVRSVLPWFVDALVLGCFTRFASYYAFGIDPSYIIALLGSFSICMSSFLAAARLRADWGSISRMACFSSRMLVTTWVALASTIFRSSTDSLFVYLLCHAVLPLAVLQVHGCRAGRSTDVPIELVWVLLLSYVVGLPLLTLLVVYLLTHLFVSYVRTFTEDIMERGIDELSFYAALHSFFLGLLLAVIVSFVYFVIVLIAIGFMIGVGLCATRLVVST